jgi:tetratricopeptide (TPR) repeat protein
MIGPMRATQKTGFACLAFLCLIFASEVQAAEPLDAEFKRATTLMGQGDNANAIPLLQDIVSKVPDNANALWNLGIAASATGKRELALQTWTRYNQVEPSDRHGIEKLVQANQALGRLEDRDHQRDRLIALRDSLAVDERKQYVSYIRDQFVAGTEHFMVQEFFEPENPYNICYKFLSLDADQKVVYVVTLESDAADTTIALELHQLQAGSRIYSIDGYEGKSHTTYALLPTRPTYDEVKAKVLKVVEGHAEVLSSTVPSK